MLPAEQDVGDALGCLCLRSLDHMGVNVAGGGDLRVAELFGNGHDVCAVGNQDAGYRMPLWYNYDKSDKPSKIKGLSRFVPDYLVLFHPKIKPRKSSKKGGCKIHDKLLWRI